MFRLILVTSLAATIGVFPDPHRSVALWGAAPTPGQLLDQRGEGEDVGQGSSANALVQIGHEMRTAHERIARSDTSRGTQDVQRKIVHDLAALIDEMKKKRGAGQDQLPSRQPESSPTASSDHVVPSREPASDSTTRLDYQTAQAPDAQVIRQWVREAWGHLPPRQLEPTLAVDFDQFLPKYERLIEQYFQRLAEDADGGGTRRGR